MAMYRRAQGLVILALITACAQPVTNTPRVSQEELQRETMMQQQMVNDRAASRMEERGEDLGRMYERLGHVAARVTRAGGQICGRLVAPEGNRCVYDVVLFQANERGEEKMEKTVNAWADGEKIVLTPAMVRFTKSDDELAYIVAHELSHNMMGHVSAQRGNAMMGAFVGMIADIAAASQGYNTQGAFSNIGGGAAMQAFSPEFEHEADYVGLYVMALAGYDTRRAPDLWRRMSVRDPDAIYMTTTHPTNPSRFVAMQKTVAEIERKKRSRRPLLPDLKPQEEAY